MADIQLDNIDTKLTTTGTNTNPFSQIALINKETKKKPYDVKFTKNEPKVNINMKYSEKQKYRNYKTKTEPKLFNKIMIDEEDDIVKTIKKAFGVEDKKNTNMTNVETSGTPYYEEPIPIQGEEPNIVEMIRETTQEPENIPDARRARRRKTSMATEITGEIAQPQPMSPARLMVIEYLKKLEERKKNIAKAEAEADEKERKRLLEISRMAKEEQTKAKLIQEKEELMKIKEKDRSKNQVKRLNEILSKLTDISAIEYGIAYKKKQEEDERKAREEGERKIQEYNKNRYRNLIDSYKHMKKNYREYSDLHPDFKKYSQPELYFERANRNKSDYNSGIKLHDVYQKYYPGDFTKFSLYD